jgi:ABC-2 type transport system permease protein
MSKSITLPILTVIAIGLALAFHAGLTVTPWIIVLFIPGLLLAFALRFLLEWTLAQSAFWTTRVSAINQIYFFLLLFLSGQIAPLSILPRAVQITAKILPFYWTIGFPTELLLGKITIAGAITGLGVQIIWVAIAVFLVRLVWRLGVKAYSAVGQ